MMRHKQDNELPDTIPLLDSLDRPNAESLEAIRESDAFFASGKPGRFDNAADLVKAALKAPEV